MGVTFKPSGIPRYLATAAVGVMTIINTGVWFTINKLTTTTSIRNEDVFLAKSSSGTGVACNGWGQCRFSGSLVVQGWRIGTGVLLQATEDARYVNTSGDTMTGALAVRANVSGATLNIMGRMSGSGILRVQSGAYFKYNVGVKGTLSGSYVSPRTVELAATGALKVGDTAAMFIVPRTMSGYKLVEARACVLVNSTSGLPTFQIRNMEGNVDILTTKLTIDANEPCSTTAATPLVVNAANNKVAAPDRIAVDVDIAGTGTQNFVIEMEFLRPN